MREFVYVSEAKLSQFRPGRTPLLRRGRDLEGEIKVPLVGSIKVGKAKQEGSNPIPDLDAVVSALDGSDRAPRWYEDEDVRAGQWVHFECPMNFRVIAGTHLLQPLVAFVGNPPSKSNDHLMLHGSAQHLVGNRPMTAELEPVRAIGSSPAALFELVRALDRENLQRGREGVLPAVKRFINWVLARQEDQSNGKDFLSLTCLGAQFSKTYEQDLVQIHRLLAMPTITAAWMAGYARVTAVVKREKRLVVATPLYVERVDGPTNESPVNIQST